MQPGQRVRKIGGDYQLEGIIVAAFAKSSGALRYVVEADVPRGLLHIYGQANLEAIEVGGVAIGGSDNQEPPA